MRLLLRIHSMAVDTFSRVRDSPQSRQWNRLATAIAVAIRPSVEPIDRIIDRFQLATFNFKQLTVQLRLHRIGDRVQDISRALVAALQKIQVPNRRSNQRVAPLLKRRPQFFD